jgi:hypothetical protein
MDRLLERREWEIVANAARQRPGIARMNVRLPKMCGNATDIDQGFRAVVFICYSIACIGTTTMWE